MAEGATGSLTFTGTVEAVELLGEASYVYLRREDGTTLIVRVPGSSHVRPGERGTASATGADIHLFDAEGRSFPRSREAAAA
jgi:multiple sugar transport system ATP-binding protein